MVTRKATALFAIILLSITLSTGCTGNAAPSTGVSAVSIAIARAAADIGLSIALQERGVSQEDAAKIVAKLREVVDLALAGKDIRTILADEKLWADAKAKFVPQLASIISENSKLEGITLVNQASAELLVSSLMDAFRAALGVKTGVLDVLPQSEPSALDASAIVRTALARGEAITQTVVPYDGGPVVDRSGYTAEPREQRLPK